MQKQSKFIAKRMEGKNREFPGKTKHGQLITNVTGIRTVQNDGTLIFHPFNSSKYNKDIHFSHYRCKAESSIGILLSSAVLIKAFHHQSSFINGSAVFHCIVPKTAQDRVSVVSWSILRKSSDKEFIVSIGQSKDRFHALLKLGYLIIDNVQKEDDGMKITCSTIDTYNSAINDLEIILSPVNQIVKKQDPVVFSCRANAFPKPVYTWFKTEKYSNKIQDFYRFHLDNRVANAIFILVKRWAPLVASNRILIDVNYKQPVLSSDLLVHVVSYKDEGIYQCVAKNPTEEKYSYSQLIVGAVKPRIINELAARQVLNQDESVILKCQATGQPFSSITWTVDGMELKMKPRFVITNLLSPSNGITSSLKIDGLRMSDGGLYQCKAENKAGIASSKSTIAITGPPTIVGFKESVSAIKTKTVKLNCIAKGYPLPTYKWQKDGWLDLTNDNQYTLLENGTLIISSVNEDNKGTFKCQATNSNGQDQKTLILHVLVPPTITPIKWAAFEVGHRKVETCEVPTGDMPIKITWYWNGKILENGRGVSIETRGFQSHLTFTVVTALHRGRYTCKAENKAGFALHSGELVINEPPSLLKYPRDTSVLKPAELRLNCAAAGFPAPQIIWYKSVRNNRKVELIRLTGRIKQLANGTLLVRSTSVEDSGKYICKADNGVGKIAEKSVTVDIKVPAAIMTTSDKTIKCRKGLSAVMNCSASGTPVLQLNWHQSSRIISDSKKFKVKVMGKAQEGQTILWSTLTISDLERGDNGRYLCQATNSFGGDSRSIQVKVLERPDPPQKPSSAKISSRSLTISWKQPYNGHSHITKYSIEYKKAPHDWMQRNTIATGGNTTRYTIAGIEPGIVYNVRIIATNKIGSSDASIEAVLKTKEEVPSAAPSNITVSAIAKDRLRVSWQPPPENKQNGKLLGYYVTCKEMKDPSQLIQRTLRNLLRHQMIIENLKPYTYYLISVQAFTKPGAGPASSPQRKRTLEGAPTAAPQSVTAVAMNSQIIRVQWNLPPIEHRHGLIKGYKIKYTELKTSKVFSTMATSVHYAELTNLDKYTVYKISVLAYTNGGDGKMSKPVLTRTAEDVPGPPEQLRAAAASPNEILVTWKPPSEPNGIITGYALHYRKSMDGSSSQHEFDLNSKVNSQMLHGLEVGKEYEIWINAKTRIGIGIRTGLVKARTMTKIPARILTLTQIIRVSINADVSLPCVAVGHPKPDISWRFRNRKVVRRRHKRAYYNEGKLVLNNVKLKHGGPYNCSAVNKYGSDWNIITLIVQGFPSTPYLLHAKAINMSTVNISWVSDLDAHSPIIRYHIKIKEHNNTIWKYHVISPEKQWILVKIGSTNKTLFSVASENIIGTGAYSVVIEVTRTSDGFVTRIISKTKTSVVEAPKRVRSKEKENMVAPIIAGCLVAVVVLTIIMLLASWDRTERRLRAPKCGRLFICDTHNDYPKGPYRGTYDGPYNEPNMPWPWNSSGNSFIATNEDSSDNNQNKEEEGGEERFPEHLFAQLLNFDETDEDESNKITSVATANEDLLASDILLGRSSSTTYKTSHSSQLSKNPFNGSSLLSSINEPSTTDSDSGKPSNYMARSLDTNVKDMTKDNYAKPKQAGGAKLKASVKSLDRGLRNIQTNVNRNGGDARNKTVRSAIEYQRKMHGTATTARSLSIRAKEHQVSRSRSTRSYDSVSSTCSSSKGELVKAYEFGRKYRLQEYYVPPFFDNSTTEDSCSELSELCEFSSLPRDTNDCLVRMPIPIRPLVPIEDANNAVAPFANVELVYDGESLV
eukprot:gene11383-12569_t